VVVLGNPMLLQLALSALLALLLQSQFLLGQSHEPLFEDYPLHEDFSDKPAIPILNEPWAKHYRTRIREGVTKSYENRDGAGQVVERKGPNFAGHYFVLSWGCGTVCLMMVIVDGKTGHVYPTPLAGGKDGDGQIALPSIGFGYGYFEYRLDSRIFVMESSCPKRPGVAGFDLRVQRSYFVIGPSGFKLVRRGDCHED
jgi:hypothetical protein